MWTKTRITKPGKSNKGTCQDGRKNNKRERDEFGRFVSKKPKAD